MMWIVTYTRSVNEIMGVAYQGVAKTYADAVEMRNLFINRHGEGEISIREYGSQFPQHTCRSSFHGREL